MARQDVNRNLGSFFAINFHRQLRSKNALGTELTQVPGIGAKTAEKLLKTFGSTAKIRKQHPENIEQVIGKAATKKLVEYFNLEQREEEE